MLSQILSIKQKQELALKPKMLQSLQMLTLPLLELELHIKQEIIKNPLLEMRDEDDSNIKDEIIEDVVVEKENEMGEATDDADKTLEEAQELTEILDSWNDFHQMTSGNREYSKGRDDGEDVKYENFLKMPEDKKSEFLYQLYGYRMKDDEYDFAKDLIDSIDIYGFLTSEKVIEDNAAVYEISLKRAKEIHQIVLSLNPKGITACDISECLIAQLDEEQQKNHILVDILANDFEDLIHRRYSKLASKYQVSVEYVVFCKQQIGKLDPKPGLRLLTNSDKYITPDIIVRKIGVDYEVIVNDSYSPNLVINSRYRKLLSSSNVDKETVHFVREKINSAKFLIKSMYMRVRTLERVMNSIIRYQYDFFYNRSGVLVPLNYAAIAEDVGVSESTISRVVKDKYADTPFGIYPLKKFFTSTAGKDNNFESISRQQVKTFILRYVDGEDKAAPLTDQSIVLMLKKDGLNVSRRIVAKYRDELNILNSRLRRD
ncbi:MAG: RNA polymerase sigma-54 factor [Candidatus Cloacimonetes bacterium 4572_65]|nr:MAG: RNA polymerase sigma-54 factor [Candidatus Cloacimonetes bacterium 4572_65]